MKGNRPEDENTRPKRQNERPAGDDRTVMSPRQAGASSQRLPWPARDAQQQQQPRKVSYYTAAESASERTQLYNSAKPAAGGAPIKENPDPVVGWLVIIDGPGKGYSVTIGSGANPIGRDPSQRISLNYGDETIHSKNHAAIVFDPRSQRFYLQSGNDVKNLTYLEDQLVLTPTELHGGETLLLGKTKIKFVALCGSNLFSWS